MAMRRRTLQRRRSCQKKRDIYNLLGGWHKLCFGYLLLVGVGRLWARGAGEKLMTRAIPLAEQKLPLSTALLSNVALVLLMWNLALVVGSWASVSL
jgi:hypothetical protein